MAPSWHQAAQQPKGQQKAQSLLLLLLNRNRGSREQRNGEPQERQRELDPR
jgi:hypothetical protein